MPTEASLEQRLAALERVVAELQLRLESAPAPAANWIERITGSFKDDPNFAEVVKYGREFREAEQLPEDFQP
jgi:hypothetical protein